MYPGHVQYDQSRPIDSCCGDEDIQEVQHHCALTHDIPQTTVLVRFTRHESGFVPIALSC